MSSFSQQPRSFAFVASRQGGGRRFGVRSAQSERALADELRRERAVLLQTWKLPGWIGTESRMSLADQATLNEQLAQLVDRGVPLVDALQVSESVVGKKQKRRVRRMAELVAAGKSFADASREAGGMDPVTVSVYRAAEKTGDLGGAGRQLAITARRRLAVSGKAITLLVYPAFVAVIGVLAALILLTFVTPTIGESLTDAGIELPAVTRLQMAAGLWIREYWFLLLGIVAAAVVLIVLARDAIAQSAAAVGRVIPVLREVFIMSEGTRFFSVLGAMTRSGVTLSDALAVATGTLVNQKARSQMERMRTRLVQGGSFARLIDDVTVFPAAIRKLLAAAEKSGELDGTFDALADDTAERLDRAASRVLAFLEPLLLVLLFLVIGFLILGLMLPMFSVVGGAGGAA
ncbi:MAG: type II secretion system F family protein [Planctomycetota bacterium]